MVSFYLTIAGAFFLIALICRINKVGFTTAALLGWPMWGFIGCAVLVAAMSL